MRRESHTYQSCSITECYNKQREEIGLRAYFYCIDYFLFIYHIICFFNYFLQFKEKDILILWSAYLYYINSNTAKYRL